MMSKEELLILTILHKKYEGNDSSNDYNNLELFSLSPVEELQIQAFDWLSV